MRYETPAAFKAALEHRLRERAPGAITRTRQLVVFSRFLARITKTMGRSVTLKGGVVLELRLPEKARTTKDIDLGLHDTPSELVLDRLQDAARLDLGDFMGFEVKADPERPTIDNPSMLYKGYRFRASCQLAGKEYGGRMFGIDVSLGEPITRTVEELVTEDWLGFAGIAPPIVRVYPVETHIAEKLHAYTMPRTHPNSRMKDLPDLALLGTVGTIHRATLLAAIDETFRPRGTHAVPRMVPEPPAEWSAQYPRLAQEQALPWKTLSELLGRVREFLNPVLSSASEATALQRWDSEAWRWRANE